MVEDLSKYHKPIGALLARDLAEKDWERYRLSGEQVEFFRENGYLKGVRVLSDEQVGMLRGELEQLMNPAHEGRRLFHEYHSNESTDPERVLFHALGAWRVMPGFHDLLWNPAFLAPASNCWAGRCDSGTTSFSASRRGMEAWWRGTRIIRIGREPRRWRISRAGLGWMTRRGRTAACIMFREAINGRTCQSRFWREGWRKAAAVCRRNYKKSSSQWRWK